MAEYTNTLDFYPLANGTSPSVAQTDNGGSRAVALTNAAAMSVDTDVKLTADARSSIKIETADGTTATSALVFGNTGNVSGSFDFIMQWDIMNTTTASFLVMFDNAATSVVQFRMQRTSGGIVQIMNYAGAVISGTPTTPVLTSANGPIRFSGWVKPGTGTADGTATVTATRLSDGVQLFSYSTTTGNFGTASPKNIQVGKVSATGATGTGIRLHVQNVVFADGLNGPPEPIAIWSPGNVDVITVTGASNASGKETSTAAQNATYDSSVWYVPAIGANVGRAIKAKEFLRHVDPSLGYGPSNAFMASYVANRLQAGRKILIVPRAHGGTGFTLPDSNGASMTWLPSAPNDANNLFWRAVDATKAALTLAGTGSKLTAILHNAGSTDGTNSTNWGVANPKEVYRGYFLQFIDGLRAELGTTTPLLLLQSRPSLIAAETRHKNVDDVLRETAGVIAGFTTRPYLAYSPSPTGTEFQAADAVHFNKAGYDAIGVGLFNVLDDAEANTPPVGGSGQPFSVVYVGSVRAARMMVNGAQVWV